MFKRIFALCILLHSMVLAAHAQLPQGLSGIVGSIVNEAQKQQQIEQQQKLLQEQNRQYQMLFNGCLKCDRAACDRALQFPISDADRSQLTRQRQILDERPALEAALRECNRDNKIASCERALKFRGIAESDRLKALQQKQLLVERAQQLRREEFQARQEQQARDGQQRREEQLARAEQQKREEQIRLEQQKVRAELQQRDEQVRLEQQSARAELQQREDAGKREQERLAQEQLRLRREAETAAQATQLERKRIADFGLAKASCSRSQEAGCHQALALAIAETEKAEIKLLLERAQAPLGLPALAWLAVVPLSTWITGSIAASLAVALAIVMRQRRAPAQAPALAGTGSIERRQSSDNGVVLAGAPANLPLLAAPPPLPARQTMPLRAETIEQSGSSFAGPDARLFARPPTLPGLPRTDRQELSEPVKSKPVSSGPNAFVRAFGSGWVYVLLYLLFMLPTYILPYYGSNSLMGNAMLSAAKMRLWPLFLHVGCFVCLVTFAVIRGRKTNRSWLPVFPVLAAVFDLVPGLNWIILLPTLLHVAAIVVGAITQKSPVQVVVVSHGQTVGTGT